MSVTGSLAPSSIGNGFTADQINVQIFIPFYNLQKCVQVSLDDTVWAVKQQILADLPKDLQEGFNYGLFLPPCNGRAGKFLLEDRPFRDYPFQDCVPYLEMKYKKRVYKSLTVNEKLLAQLHTKTSLKRFIESVEKREVKKIEDMCSLGLDPNFHNPNGETPLTLAAVMDNNRAVIMALVAGGGHLDFRNLEGQTPLHRAVFLSSHLNVKTLLDLGSAPNCKDPLGLTPLYYSMLRPNTSPNSAELLLRDYAEIGTVDPHGNQEIHQACKNGLVSHLEHLLYYGAEIDSQNINGNTPLHICAVNNQEACARVLLFRSADAAIANSQGQTAYHVAVITGHVDIANLLKNHNPQEAVPYRSQPRYNSKRRLTWSRSCSSSRRTSIASLSQCDYGTVKRLPSRSVSEAASPAMGRSQNLSTPYYGTVTSEYRPMLVQAVKKALANSNSSTSTLGNAERNVVNKSSKLPFVSSEVNVPRILVIPRGPHGFGFILRGAKKMDDAICFEPTLETPALQYFESIDVNGMAMKAGLKPNDFLLEINGVDVRCCSHDQVVKLIHACEETITIKVVTVTLSTYANGGSMYGTLRQVKRAAQRPGIRSCSSSLSLASGRLYTPKLTGTMKSSCGVDNNNDIANNKQELHYLPAAYRDPKNKVASIKCRPSSRRISASELEQLMSRQNNADTVSMMSTSLDESTATLQNPKVYTSVSEMKRTKQKSGADTEIEVEYRRSQPSLKSFNSSPNLRDVPMEQQKTTKQSAMIEQIYANGKFPADSSATVQRKKVARPKTPPPPPPPLTSISRRESSSSNAQENCKTGEHFRPVFSPPLSLGGKTLSLYQKPVPVTPPPFDPIGANGRSESHVRTSDNGATNIQVLEPSVDEGDHKLFIQVKSDNAAKGNRQQSNDDSNTGHLYNRDFNFNCNLQTAIARRLNRFARSSITSMPQSTSFPPMQEKCQRKTSVDNFNCNIDDKHYIKTVRCSKKDSGYGSSRNSLDKNESDELLLQKNGFENITVQKEAYINGGYLDNVDQKNGFVKQTLNGHVSSKEQDSLSMSSTLSSLSACSSERAGAEMTNCNRQKLTKKPSDPPPDYDELDSGNAESDSEINVINPQTFSFQKKCLTAWTVNDVCRWLDSLYLSEYKRNFARSSVDGVKLMNCGRAQFAQLGVTRVAHRLAMESSLKQFRPTDLCSY